jgi:hypothetical protein
MTSLSSWCFDLISRLLDDGEREVLRGDLAEAHISGGQAVCELLGLVARRQAILWKSLPPWIVLIAVIYLLVPLLALCLDATRETLAASLNQPPDAPLHFRCVLVSGSCLTFLWAWDCGFVLAAISPRTVWITVPLFYLAAFVGVPYSPFGQRAFLRQWNGGFDQNWPTLLVNVALFLLPSIWALRHGLHTSKIRLTTTLFRAALLAMLVAALSWSAAWDREAAGDRLWGYAILSWPLVYMLATSFVRPARRSST